jgi:hypothetical protein
MPRKALLGGIGAVGSAMARFFHPSKKIHDTWPQDDKRRVEGVLVVDEGIRKIRHKDQMCYLVRINEIENIIFHIAKRNFKVTAAGALPFASEKPAATVVPALNAPVIDDMRASTRNVVPNAGNLSRGGTREEIEELRRNGITVDNDNNPAPKNAVPEVIPHNGTWEKPTFCIRRANPDFSDTARKFKSYRWDKIADFNEMQLFLMCFPNEFFYNVIIPTTNKTLAKKLTGGEF